MASTTARFIVTGLFERAKRDWTTAIIAKFVVAIIGFIVAIRPGNAAALGLVILVAETMSATCFYRAERLKAQAEPVLARLDLEDSLGWATPKSYIDELAADFGTFSRVGQRIRGDDAYFSPGEIPIGWRRLSNNMSESALYTRTIAAAARNVIFTLCGIMISAVAIVLISGIYRQAYQGTNAAGEFLVDALLFLVTIDLLPLGFRYHTLRCEATQTRSVLSSLSPDSNEAAVVPIAIQYQLARAVAPLLPTYAFLRKRFPLGAIWSEAEQ